MGGKGRRDFRNNYKGPMDKAEGGRIEGDRWGWVGWGESGGGKMETTLLEQQQQQSINQ